VQDHVHRGGLVDEEGLDEILHGSIVNRIMRETRNIDVVIVAEDNRAHNAAS